MARAEKDYRLLYHAGACGNRGVVGARSIEFI